MAAEQARFLLATVPVQDENGRDILIGLRDRALIAVMAYAFARVSAVIQMHLRIISSKASAGGFACTRKGADTMKCRPITRPKSSYRQAQAIAAHESLRTTKLYDRASDVLTLDEIEPHRNLNPESVMLPACLQVILKDRLNPGTAGLLISADPISRPGGIGL